jgi:hypothetical protein
MLDSEELKNYFENDQAQRSNIDFNNQTAVDQVEKDDISRRERVSELFSQNNIKTAADYYYAAMIFQHSHNIEDIEKAMEWSEISRKLGESRARWLSAATIDRYLMYSKKPQKYGTQFTINKAENEWELWPVDANTTDTQRQERDVPAIDKIEETISLLPKLKF